MSHLITRLLLILLLPVTFLSSVTAAEALLCHSQQPEQVLAEVNKRVINLRVANFNADLALMETEYNGLTSYLQSCITTDTAKLTDNNRYVFACGVECHRQMARYQLFMARDFSLLSQRAEQPTATPKAARLQHVVDGMAWIERGLATLPRQQAVKKALFAAPNAANATKNTQSTSVSTDADSFNRYLADLAKLRITQLQLLMAGGDLWYQSVSQPRLQRLDYMVGQVLGQKPTATSDCAAKTDAKSKADCEANEKSMDVNMQKAVGYYEQALWILIEAKTDIPPGDQNFSGVQTELNALDQDLRRRRDSIQQGLLYIGIDPDRYTRLSFTVLADELQTVGNSIKELETKVAGYVRDWQTKKANVVQANEQAQQATTAMAMQVSGHKIGKLQSQLEADLTLQEEQQSKVARDRLHLQKQYANAQSAAEREQLAFAMETVTANHASRLRQIEAQLQRNIAEKQQEQQLIAQRGKQDVLALDIQAQEQQRSELRWLIDFDIARTNLIVQIEALNAQTTEYDRQINSNKTVLDRLTEQRTQLEEEKQQLAEKIKQAKAQIADFKLQKTELFNLRQASFQAQICGIQATLTILGRNPQPVPACGISAPPTPTIAVTRAELGQLQAKYAHDQTQAAAFILTCVIGTENSSKLQLPVDLTKLPQVTCPNPSDTQLQLAKKLWDTEQLLTKNQLDRYEQVRKTLLGNVQKLRSYLKKFKEAKEKLEKFYAVAEQAYGAMASVPMAGFSIDLGAAAQRVYELAKSQMERGVKWIDNEMEKALKEGDLDGKLQAAEDQLSKLQDQKKTAELAYRRTLAQLNTDAQTQTNKLMDSLYGQEIGKLQTTLDDSQFEKEVQKLTAEQQTLQADLALASRNQRFEFRIAAEESQIRQFNAQIRQVESRQRELELEQQAKARDNQQITALQQSVQRRVDLTNGLVGRIDGKAKQSTDMTGVLGQMRDQFKQGAMALSETERAALDKAMQHDKEAAQAEIQEQDTLLAQKRQQNQAELAKLKTQDAFQRAQLELEAQELDITAQHLKFRRKTQEKITQEQDSLLTQAQTELERRKNQPSAMELVLSNEADLSQLLDGIPEFLASKGALLDHANTMLHLLRGKTVVIDSLSSRDLTPIYKLDVGNDLPYVLTYNQLNDTLTRLQRGVELNDSLVNTTGVSFTIPAASGLFQALTNGEPIRFELSPGDTRNNAAGYFNLWNNELEGAKDARLVDVWIGLTYTAEAPIACNDDVQEYTISHVGSGFVFIPISIGSTTVAPAFSRQPRRSLSGNALDLSDPSNATAYKQRVLKWYFPVQGQLMVRHFIEAGEGDEPTLPFMGLPLAATYELALPINTDCPLTAAHNLKIAFVYSNRVTYR